MTRDEAIARFEDALLVAFRAALDIPAGAELSNRDVARDHVVFQIGAHISDRVDALIEEVAS